MSKKKKVADRITTKKDYLDLFPDDKESKAEKMRFLALKEAQEVRKFEIELYWKRTGFFWAFITIIYTALFSVLCKYVDNSQDYTFFVPVISTLSGLGFFFSVAWHMVNKGSKFWQKNWETHVSLLEKSEIGSLYDVYLNPKKTGSRFFPTSEFDFSVTKVNMWASFSMMICSFAGCFFTNFWLIHYRSESIVSTIIPTVFIFVFSILLIFLSNGNSCIEISDSEQAELNMICIK